jgi:hypothetical protein
MKVIGRRFPRRETRWKRLEKLPLGRKSGEPESVKKRRRA